MASGPALAAADKAVSGTFPTAGIAPTEMLATFSNDAKGTIQPDGSVIPDDVDVLAWVVAYHDAPGIRHGGPWMGPGATRPSPPPGLCDDVVVIDATSGAWREMWQDCNRREG